MQFLYGWLLRSTGDDYFWRKISGYSIPFEQEILRNSQFRAFFGYWNYEIYIGFVNKAIVKKLEYIAFQFSQIIINQ